MILDCQYCTAMNSRYPYPVQTLRHWYMAPVGGFSQSLEPGQVGLCREALAENTDLVPFQDRVSLARLWEDRPRPLFMRKLFQVVALDRSSADAFAKSPHGEVVLPLEVAGNGSWPMDLEAGDMVILNGVLSQRPPRGKVLFL
jgi:hypothetical protein